MAKSVPEDVIEVEVEVEVEDTVEEEKAEVEIFVEPNPVEEVATVNAPVANPVRVRAGSAMPVARSTRRP